MRVVIGAAVMLSLVPTAALARWSMLVDDDIFSGGKKAMMIGDIGPDNSVAIDCTSSGDLHVAYIEKGDEDDIDQSASYRLLIKVDDQPVIEFAAKGERRNDRYNEITSDDRDAGVGAIKAIASAKRKILIGVSMVDSDGKYSGSASVVGSSRAASQLMKACGIS